MLFLFHISALVPLCQLTLYVIVHFVGVLSEDVGVPFEWIFDVILVIERIVRIFVFIFLFHSDWLFSMPNCSALGFAIYCFFTFSLAHFSTQLTAVFPSKLPYFSKFSSTVFSLTASFCIAFVVICWSILISAEVRYFLLIHFSFLSAILKCF